MPRSQSTERCAATYARMSTDKQQYSLASQSDAIGKYARDHNLTIVKEFVDAARSGLTLAGRAGLRQLLFEVISGSPNFTDVLVYDVSRWGRFQDTDEAAFYEFTCKKADIRVHYCVEEFENNAGPYSTLLKAMKRTMAAEYSRELSARVFKAHARLAVMGYRQGGVAGYGLRRAVVDSDGRRRTLLRSGDTKAIHSDRVILVPGPKQEIRVVRRIFRWYTMKQMSEARIAKLLNERVTKIEPDTRWSDPKWTVRRVHDILSNPKYIGANVYNRISLKLNKTRVRNGTNDWTRVDGAFTPIVSVALFEKAQQSRLVRAQSLTNEQILDSLRDLLRRKGSLSLRIINSDDKTPNATTVWQRFGSLLEAYRLVGYK